MRIFVASGIFHPDSGGPATYLYRLLPELLARGHSVRVLTFGEPTANDRRYPYPLQRVSLHQPLLKRRGQFRALYRAEVSQADLVYRNLPDLPHAGDGHLPRVLKIVGDPAWERAVNRGWVPPTTDVDIFQQSRYSPVIEMLKVRRAWEVRQVDRIIVPSRYLREMVIGWGAAPDRIQVIYNALDAGQYDPKLSREAARSQLGLDPNAPLLLTAARLTAWKGVDHLISALVQRSYWQLLVAGDGPQQAALSQLAAQLGVTNRVRFLGKVPHEQLAGYMRAADYFVLYSGYEGLSHVILEALTAGTPVIASARGGNPELVSDGLNGLLVPHPDVSALAMALDRAADAKLRAHLDANVRKGLERFGWQALVAHTVLALETVGQG